MSKKPFLDVTDVLDDPDFNEDFVLIRRKRFIDNGVGHVIEQVHNFRGVIQPATSRTLERLNQGDWKNGGVEIWCKQRLEVNTNLVLPDEILWERNRYICTADQDWTHYGRGYIEMVALLVYGEDGYDKAEQPFGEVVIGVDPSFDYSVKRMLANAKVDPELVARFSNG